MYTMQCSRHAHRTLNKILQLAYDENNQVKIEKKNHQMAEPKLIYFMGTTNK